MRDLEIFTSGGGLVGIRFTTGTIEDGRLVEYVPQEGDVIVADGRLFNDDVEIGTIVGPDGAFLLTVDRYEASGFQDLFVRTNSADEVSNAAIDQIADWSVEVNGEIVEIADLFRKSKIAESARLDGFQRGFVQEHVIHLDLGRAVNDGDEITITAPGGLLDGETVVIDTRGTRSDAVHVNQVGFAPDDVSKIAVLSTWLGVEVDRPENAQQFQNGVEYEAGTAFHVVDAATNERVFTGEIELLVSAEALNTKDNGGRTPVNLAAADTWLMDFSALSDPGTYVVEVEGIGTSYEFEIAEDVWTDLFVTGARGFYHQRSGIALEQPYTDWERPASLSPEDGQVAFQSTASILDTANGFALGGWIEAADYEAVGLDPEKEDAELYTFTVLENGSTGEIVEDAWGGWHDAGDWDRRTQHLEASNRMLELFEIDPGFFEGIELNIPESGNGLPDLLDEALWNVDFFQRLQKADGGVPGGIEGGVGPNGEGFQYGEASWANSRDLFVYAPDPWSSAEFAASAARAARIVEPYDAGRAAQYLSDAEAALEWAIDNWIEPGDRRFGSAEREQILTDARNLAALELYKATGDARWEAEFLATSTHANGGPTDYYDRQIDSVFSYLTMDASLQDPDLAAAMRADFLNLAEAVLANYGTPSGFATSDNPFAPYTFASTGTNPREAADVLARAHALTGDERFLADAIDDANFALGMNPDNVSFVSGVGDEQVRELLIGDAEALGGALPPGIVAYGNYDYVGNSDAEGRLEVPTAWPFGTDQAAFPQNPLNWPGYESWQGFFDAVPLSEYTVDQPMSTSTFLWGYLAQLNDDATDYQAPGGLERFDAYELQIGSTLTLIDAEQGFTVRQFGAGENLAFADGVVGTFEESGAFFRLSLDDPGDAYAWARLTVLSDANDEREWDRIDTTFGEAGEVLARAVRYDDGVTVDTTFAGGVPVRSVLADERDARVWDAGDLRFADGVLSSSSLVYDDATTAWINYADGERANVTRADPNDVQDWDTIYIEFQDGLVASRYVTRDNGDTIAAFYDDGRLERVVLEDLSDSRPWSTKTTTYDAEGNVLDVLLV